MITGPAATAAKTSTALRAGFAPRAHSAPLKLAAAGLAALVSLLPLDAADARGRNAGREEYQQSRPAGAPVLAVVSLRRQQVTVYDADGWVMRAPVSSGRSGYETPAGIYSILQKRAEHYSNLYDDAAMPFMQRLTWSGIALHAGDLPGYPASHGCVRMPHGFAERFFSTTKLGMRVIVMREDIAPASMSHPMLFRPLAEEPAVERVAGPHVVVLDTGAQPVATFKSLRKLAAAKAAEAEEAAGRLEQARKAAAAKYREAAQANRTLRIARSLKARADAHVREIERRLSATTDPTVVEHLQQAREEAVLRVSQLQAQLEGVQAQVQPVLDETALLRQAAVDAQQAKTAAEEEAREARRKIAPVSVFISRAKQRLYVRQHFKPLFESDVTIASPEVPLGTHVLTALSYEDGETSLRWSAVSMRDGVAHVHGKGRGDQSSRRGLEPLSTDTAKVKAALDRITVPADVRERIEAIISPGSAVIVSDEPLSRETGPATDFIVVMSDEPQGGIKIRSRATETSSRYERFMRRSPYGYGSGWSW